MAQNTGSQEGLEMISHGCRNGAREGIKSDVSWSALQKDIDKYIGGSKVVIVSFVLCSSQWQYPVAQKGQT